MTIKWRKINRVLHRDLGYFFTGMILIYALSGVALNHSDDWNPNYIINVNKVKVAVPPDIEKAPKKAISKILQEANINIAYKNHYFPKPGTLKIFLKKGSSVVIDLKTGESTVETLRKRPLFYEINLLHYNPGKLWKWFSDIFAVSLIILAISGLFILKGKNGIKRRGAWFSFAGLLTALLFLVFYL
jgi:hypothetical protein